MLEPADLCLSAVLDPDCHSSDDDDENWNFSRAEIPALLFRSDSDTLSLGLGDAVDLQAAAAAAVVTGRNNPLSRVSCSQRLCSPSRQAVLCAKGAPCNFNRTCHCAKTPPAAAGGGGGGGQKCSV